MNKKAKNTIKLVLSLALAIVLVWFSFKSIDWPQFWANLQCTRWGFVLLFCICAILAILIRALRWHKMIKPLDPDIKLPTTWDANNIGNLTNAVISGSGELVRCAIVSKGGAQYNAVLGTEIMERAWDGLAIMILVILSIVLGSDVISQFFSEHIWGPLAGNPHNALWVTLVVLIIVVVVILSRRLKNRYTFFNKLYEFFHGLVAGFSSFRNMQGKGLFLVYTAFLWGMYILMYLFVLKSIPALSGLGITDAILLAAIGNIASVIPVPGGIGAYHYLIALSLSTIYGINWEIGILFATLQHELHAVLLIVLGIISYAHNSIHSDSH